MKALFILILSALLITSATVYAQDSSTRFKKQHMKLTEASLVLALNNSESIGVQTSAAQTIRQLEWTFPEEPFNSLLSPLIRIVKDENAETQLRLLAALALDGLHEDNGDAAIESVAKSSGNKSVQELCSALLIKTGK
jgi:HEAT repeat protein